MKISQRDYNKIKLNTSVTILKYQLSEANESQLKQFQPLRQLVLLDSIFRKSAAKFYQTHGVPTAKSTVIEKQHIIQFKETV
jgi:hypothetical protein